MKGLSCFIRAKELKNYAIPAIGWLIRLIIIALSYSIVCEKCAITVL